MTGEQFVRPLPEGVSQGPLLCRDLPSPPQPILLTASMDWGSLVPEYTFFTPALLYLSTPMPLDPFSAYSEETGKPAEVMYLSASLPVFNGLMAANQDMTYNFLLFGMRTEQYKPFEVWLGQCAWWDARGKSIRYPGLQPLRVRDHAWVSRNPASHEIPTVPAVGWCLATTLGTFRFAGPPASDPLLRPTGFFDRNIVAPETAVLAEALHAEHANPYSLLCRPAPYQGIGDASITTPTVSEPRGGDRADS